MEWKRIASKQILKGIETYFDMYLKWKYYGPTLKLLDNGHGNSLTMRHEQ